MSRRYIPDSQIKKKKEPEAVTPPAKAKYDPAVGIKDDNNIYVPRHMTKEKLPDLPVGDNVSIDQLLKSGLKSIEHLLKIIWADISTDAPERVTIQNLKDCVTMLLELKKKEQDFLDSLSDAELAKLAAKDEE